MAAYGEKLEMKKRTRLMPLQASSEKKKKKKRNRLVLLRLLRPSFLVLQAGIGKKTTCGRKNRKKKPKPSSPSYSSFSPNLNSTSITLKKTNFSTTTIIATTEVVHDVNKQVNLYFCISMGSTFNWYKIDPRKEIPTTTQAPILVCTMPISTPKNFVSVPAALHSKIYAIGGLTADPKCKPSPKAFVCDLTCSDIPPVWEELPSMTSPKLCRAAPTLSSLDGQLFAIGSLESNPSAKVFHPTSNSWTSLPSIPSHLRPGSLINCVFARERNEIIIFSGTHDSALSFNFTNSTWKSIPLHGIIHHNHMLAKSIALEDVIYTFHTRNLYAFHLHMPNSLQQVSGLEKLTSSIGEDDNPHLVRIGHGRMCLVYARQQSDGFLHVYSSTFSVGTYIRTNQFHAIAVLTSSDEYVVQGSRLHACLAV